MDRPTDTMRTFWDARARENAAWYVDTSCDYDAPDMDAFFATGQRVVDEALLQAPVRADRRELAVEIGCGLGRISVALAGHFERVVGIDISEEMLRRARDLVDDPRVELRLGNGTDLRPLADGSADFVTTFTVLQHLPGPELVEGYLRESARILRPGGVMAMQWNNLPHPGLWQARARWWRLRHRIGGPLALDPRVSPAFVGTRVPLARVEGTLRAEGLEIAATRGLGTLFAWIWARKPT